MKPNEREIIKKILMDQGISEENTDTIISVAVAAYKMHIKDGDLISAYNVCKDYLGIDPEDIFKSL